MQATLWDEVGEAVQEVRLTRKRYGKTSRQAAEAVSASGAAAAQVAKIIDRLAIGTASKSELMRLTHAGSFTARITNARALLRKHKMTICMVRMDPVTRETYYELQPI